MVARTGLAARHPQARELEAHHGLPPSPRLRALLVYSIVNGLERPPWTYHRDLGFPAIAGVYQHAQCGGSVVAPVGSPGFGAAETQFVEGPLRPLRWFLLWVPWYLKHPARPPPTPSFFPTPVSQFPTSGLTARVVNPRCLHNVGVLFAWMHGGKAEFGPRGRTL